MSQVLDRIELNDGNVLYGIVDYVSKREAYFFDLGNESHEDYTMLAVLWKGNNPRLRFSVYCAIEYPYLPLPKAIIIPLNSVKESSVKFTKTKNPKSKRSRRIRLR